MYGYFLNKLVSESLLTLSKILELELALDTCL